MVWGLAPLARKAWTPPQFWEKTIILADPCVSPPVPRLLVRPMTDATHPLKRLLQYSGPRRAQVGRAVVYSVLNKILDLAPPALIGAAVDIVVEREDSLFARLGLVDVTHQLIALAAVTIVVWGLESIFEYLLESNWRNLAQWLQHDLRVDAYDHVQSLDMQVFHKESTGGLMAVLNDDINQLERFLDQGANDLIQVFTTAVVISIAFFVLAPGIAWMAMLPIPFVLWGSFKFQALLSSKYADVRQRVGDVNAQLANNLTGIATIKSFTTEALESQRIRDLSDAYRSSNERAIALSAAFSPLIRMVIVVGFATTLIWGGKLAIGGELAVGTYSVLVFLTQRLLWPLTRLGRTFDLYQRAMASTRRVFDLLATPIGITSGTTPLPSSTIRGHLRFDHVDFAYTQREPILQDFSLEVTPGMTLGIVGATGSGKTTLINLLLRFYTPDAGSITLDGIPIDELRLDDLRQGIGLVSQNTFLFQGTVAQNIAYGSGEAPKAQILAAAQAAEATEFVEKMPLGFDTLVGQRGDSLSGGQRQRLSIARVLLKDPPILIFDEATSAVDNETEAALQRSLDAVSAGRTTILIAHRLSTIRHADRIVVLDHGAIVESGKHEELLAKRGQYARLWAIQTGLREERVA